MTKNGRKGDRGRGIDRCLFLGSGGAIDCRSVTSSFFLGSGGRWAPKVLI